MRKIERFFGKEIENIQAYRTPGAPGEGIVRMRENEEGLNDQDQFKYRSAVGMLLFLVKYSRPDISNSVRELSKVNDRANKAHYKQMLRAIKYVIDTRNTVLKLKPEKKDLMWNFKCLCDSDYAGDKDTRLSLTGYCVYVNDCLISWKLRVQQCNTLPPIKALYVALSEICCEILFVKQVLEFLEEEINYPITVYSDYVRAIFLVTCRGKS